jgi:ribosome assembly protein YihI (activator of Der GTPase)
MNPIRQETASNISLLPRDSIVDTVSRLRASRKIFTDLDVNIDALLEEVNDLLSAMGLVADDEFGDEFIRQTASKDKVSANLHEDFEAGQLDGDCQKKTAFLA